MVMKVRNTTLRGGGGGGKISVFNQSGGVESAVSLGVTQLIWATQDGLGFSAVVDPDDPTRVIIGNPPEFLEKIQWTTSQTTQLRISESDLLEADTYLTNGKETTTMAGSTNNLSFSSTTGRGFGPESRLSVKTYHAGVLVDDTIFTCGGNGSQTEGNVTIFVSNYAPDGDGSVFQGKLNVTINGDGLIGSTNSGVVSVEISFLEQKFTERVNINQDTFRDKNPSSPSIDGGSTVRDHDDATQTVTKFLSGIQYFDLGSLWQFESLGISNLNEDSSHPNANLTVDAEELGVTTYTSSPWGVDAAEWNNVTNLDTVQGIDYITEREINKSNFYHCGTATVNNSIRDSWNDAPVDTSNTLKVCIDTYSQPSTDSVEYFTEENMRLANADLTSSWDSEAYCTDGDAIVFGGKLMHGSDLPRILENVQGGLGSAGSLSSFLPNRKPDGTPRQNPNYAGHNRPAVFWRKFLTGNATSYPTMNINIMTNGDLANKLANGDIKIYVWKLDSTDTVSPNLNKPTSYSPVNPDASLANSLWGHVSYDFAAFDEGVSQTAGGSGMIVNQTGNLLSLSFSGYNVLEGVLVRFEIKKGTTIDEVSVIFV
jgi:hypothetical protein